jgi:hypothetical protein
MAGVDWTTDTIRKTIIAIKGRTIRIIAKAIDKDLYFKWGSISLETGLTK